jgi:hypothetical protein
MPDVRRLGAVLAITRVVDRQHPAGMRRGRRIGAQQFQPTIVDLLVVPPGLAEEELQPLHRRVLRPDYRLGPGQRGQCLVPVPRREQPGQILAKPAPLRQGPEHVIEPGRIPLQRPRRRRNRLSSRHRAPIDRASYHGILRI